jgi:hypothetical protein
MTAEPQAFYRQVLSYKETKKFQIKKMKFEKMKITRAEATIDWSGSL